MGIGLMTLAGALSGAGQAGEKGLASFQNNSMLQHLQDERQKMELNKLQLQQEFEAGQQVKQQDFTRGQEQERRGYEERKQSLAFSPERIAQESAAAELRAKAALNTKENLLSQTASVNTEEFNLGAPLREQKREEERANKKQDVMDTAQLTRDALQAAVNDPGYLAAVEKMKSAEATVEQKAAAQAHIATAVFNNYKALAEKDVRDARAAYSAALYSKDPARIQQAKSHLDVVDREGNRSDNALYAAMLHNLDFDNKTLQSSIKAKESELSFAVTPADQERLRTEMEGLKKDYEENRAVVESIRKQTGQKLGLFSAPSEKAKVGEPDLSSLDPFKSKSPLGQSTVKPTVAPSTPRVPPTRTNVVKEGQQQIINAKAALDAARANPQTTPDILKMLQDNYEKLQKRWERAGR